MMRLSILLMMASIIFFSCKDSAKEGDIRQDTITLDSVTDIAADTADVTGDAPADGKDVMKDGYIDTKDVVIDAFVDVPDTSGDTASDMSNRDVPPILDCTVDTGSVQTTAPQCRESGGVCVAEGKCNGTVVSEHKAECTFDDGSGDCCVPPSASKIGDTCAEHGGVCAPIAGCDFTNGWFSPSSDCQTSFIEICCVPYQSCGGYEQYSCCIQGETSFRPVCDRGHVNCSIEQTVLMCTNDCITP